MKLVYDDRVATYKDIGQEVSFSIPDGILGVAVSGGLDSAALIFLICRYITDLKLEDKIKLKPIHSVSKQQSNSLAITQSIIEDVYKKYPNIDIDDLEVFFYDCDNIKTFEKASAHDIFYDRLYKENSNFTIITAATAAPPKHIVETWPTRIYNEDGKMVHWLINRVDNIRDVHVYRKNGVYEYKPFLNINKLLIASMHKFLNLDERYIKETWTCTSMLEFNNTKNFTEPCGTCSHCWEKKWAFGSF